MKAVIVEDNREVGGRLIENTEFLRFAFHWGSGSERAGRIGPERRARSNGR